MYTLKKGYLVYLFSKISKFTKYFKNKVHFDHFLGHTHFTVHFILAEEENLQNLK